MSCGRDGEVDAAGAVQKQGPGALPFPRPEGKDVLWVGTVRATWCDGLFPFPRVLKVAGVSRPGVEIHWTPIGIPGPANSVGPEIAGWWAPPADLRP